MDIRCQSASRASRAGPGRFLYRSYSPFGASASTSPSSRNDPSVHATISISLLWEEANKPFGQARVFLFAYTGPPRITQPISHDMLQPILDQRNDLQNLDEDMYPDAVSCFISTLLPAVSEKSLSLIPQIATQPQLLSHFVHELMSFDMTVRDSWAYTPSTNLLADWQGLTSSTLGTKNYFEIWLQAERQFASERYIAIRDAAESGELDLESTDSRTTKPTKGAVRVNDLLETVTDRYRHLTSFAYKIKFLVGYTARHIR